MVFTPQVLPLYVRTPRPSRFLDLRTTQPLHSGPMVRGDDAVGVSIHGPGAAVVQPASLQHRGYSVAGRFITDRFTNLPRGPRLALPERPAGGTKPAEMPPSLDVARSRWGYKGDSCR